MEKPRGKRRKTNKALNKACTRGSAKRKALACVFADPAIVAESLDVQETSVGLEADLPQSGEIMQPFVDLEVTRVVDGGLGA